MTTDVACKRDMPCGMPNVHCNYPDCEYGRGRPKPPSDAEQRVVLRAENERLTERATQAEAQLAVAVGALDKITKGDAPFDRRDTALEYAEKVISNQVQTAENAVATLPTRAKQLLDVVTAAEQGARWFREYEAGHRAKSTTEGHAKADRNRDRALYIENALAAYHRTEPVSSSGGKLQTE